MDITLLAQGGMMGIVTAFGYGALRFFKKNAENKQAFEPAKLGKAILLYGAVGILLGMTGMTADTGLFDAMTLIFSSSLLVDNTVKVAKATLAPKGKIKK